MSPAKKSLKSGSEVKTTAVSSVCHAYFTGADQPYEKLQRALRAEIDEAAWSALYSTHSYPFERPTGGKIAAKVINHYGDKVLKVYAV